MLYVVKKLTMFPVFPRHWSLNVLILLVILITIHPFNLCRLPLCGAGRAAPLWNQASHSVSKPHCCSLLVRSTFSFLHFSHCRRILPVDVFVYKCYIFKSLNVWRFVLDRKLAIKSSFVSYWFSLSPSLSLLSPSSMTPSLPGFF